MSHQGTEWAVNCRGVNRGEKAVLMQIGHELDQRSNVARISLPVIADRSEMSLRQVIRVLQQLQDKKILKRIGGGDGRGNVSLYSFLGFVAKKISPAQRVTFQHEKGDIPARKGDIPASAIRKERTSEELQEEKRGTTEALSARFSQSDFDERDLRMIGQVKRRFRKWQEEHPSSSRGMTDGQYYALIAEEAGVTVTRVLQLEELQAKWPDRKQPQAATA